MDPVQNYESRDRSFIGMDSPAGSEMDDYNRILHDPALATDSNPGNMANTERVINHLTELKSQMKIPTNPYHNYSEYQKYRDLTSTESSHMAVIRGMG